MSKIDFPPSDKTPPTAMEIALGAAEEKKRIVKEEKERSFGEDVGAELFSTLREAMVKNPASDPTDANPSVQGKDIASDGLLEMAEAESEGTPLEWREKLRGYIEAAKEKLNGSEQVEKLKAYLTGRSKELDTEAVGYGARIEKFIRDKGEEYNKLSLTKKLLISAVLGVGAAAFSTVSAPLATAFAINLGIQRFGGMASMYLKFEKHLQETAEGTSTGFFGRREWYQDMFKGTSEKQRKAAATFMAVYYSIGMSAVIGGTVALASESTYGHAVHEWLKSHYPFGEAGVTATRAGATEAVPSPAPAPSVPEVAPHASATPDTSVAPVEPAPPVAPVSSATAEMPTVGASSHGYEGMLKDLMKQLPDEPPANMNPDSDLAKLFEARAHPESIGKILHKIALDHKFATDDGSVLIDTSAQMSIGADGQAHFIDTAHSVGVIDAVDDMKILHPHTAPPPDAIPAPAKLAPDVYNFSPTQSPAPVSDAIPKLVEYPVTEVGPSTSTHVISPEQYATTLVEPHPIGEAVTNALPTQVKDTLPLGNDSIDSSVRESVTPTTVAEHAHSIVNAFNVEVSTVEPHFYADGENHLYMYGGSPDQQINTISEYLTKNPNSTVFGTSIDGKYRIPWTYADGKVVPGAPIRTQGLFGFFSSWMKAPSPDEFEKFIK